MSYHIKANTDITLLSANDILEICNPLFNNSNINYFDYFRAYNDGSRFWLCSSIKWIEYIYQQKYWQTNNFKISLNANFEPLLWQDVMRLMAKEDAKLYHDKIKDAYNYFNIKNGLAITDKQKNYTDYYNFGIAENDCSGYRINTGEIELLKKFIIYFREKANSFLREASKYKMQFSLDLYECDKKHKNHKYLLDINKIAFENQTAINRYYLSDHKNTLPKERYHACDY